MNKIFSILLALCVFTVSKSSADDIDIYLNGAAAGGNPYVHLTLDYRPSVFSNLCTYGSSCNVIAANGSCPSGVCFTQDAYNRLLSPLVPTAGDTITRFDAFVAVLSSVVANPLFANINMALLVSNFDNGGTILKGYRRLGGYYLPLSNIEEPPGAILTAAISGGTAFTGAEQLITTMQLIPSSPNGGPTHKLQPKETYFEWFRYLNGGAIALGDETNRNFGFANGVTPVPDYDGLTMNSLIPGLQTDYVAPFPNVGSCSKLFSILVAMNAANQDNFHDGLINTEMGAPTGGSFQFEDLLDYMHASTTDLVDDSVLAGVNPLEKTWVISDAGSLGATGDWAIAGGSGSPLNIDQPAQLQVDLLNAFKEVLSVSSTFVAASVPVNVFNRAESLDNLFVALFEAKATQNWPGNIKKLKLRDIDGDGDFDDIIDASSTPKPGFATTGPDRGRVTFDALTYWTIAATLPAVAGTIAPIGADGREVARGGAGQKINGFVPDATHALGDTNAPVGGVMHRQVFVEPNSFTNGTATAFDNFNADTATLALTGIKAALGNAAMTDPQATALIKWGRGQDVAAGSSNARNWIMSDAIHSRPLAINYGAVGGYSVANPNIRLFFGTGDGMFHMLENTTAGGAESGKELFAFYPRELLKNIAIRFSNTIPSTKMRYGVDGPPVAWVVDNNSDGNLVASGAAPAGGDKAYVYFGLRRGGASYYALDVSNPAAAPKIKWKISRTVGGDFDELGLTFSRPLVTKVNYNGTAKNVVIFTAGYNGGWDATYTNRIGKDLNNSPDNTVGNAIYIVDAETGALIWKAAKGTATGTNTEFQHADLVDSFPSDITSLENAAGITTRLYVGDSGGAVWRVDLPSLSTDTRATRWFVSKFAELGYDGTTPASDRRFFHAPDVVETFDSGGNFDGVIISSGDRAHPNELAVSNYHFYLKDRKIVSGDTSVIARTPISVSNADLPDQTLCILGTEGSCNSSFPKGWKVGLTGSGEKGLSTALVDGGRIFMSTFVPASGAVSCAPTEGQGRVYVANLEDGTATFNDRFFDVGSGIPSEAITLGDSILIPGAGIDPNSPSDPNETPCEGKLCASATEKIHKIYWRESGIDNL